MPKFIIKNFMAIKEAKLNVSGFTILLGDSSAGKTSCLKAIYAATNNRFRIGQVRYGEDSAIIKVKYDDDERILVVERSSKGSPRMKLGNKEFSKLSRSVPIEVADFNNFGKLKVGDEDYSLNFFSQFQKPLLLEFSQKKVEEILSSSQGLNDLLKAKDLISAERSNNDSAFSNITSILDKTQADLSMTKFELGQVNDKTFLLQTKLSKYDELDKKIARLEECRSKITAFKNIVDKIDISTKLQFCLNCMFTVDNSQNLALRLDSALFNISVIDKQTSIKDKLTQKLLPLLEADSKELKLKSLFNLLVESDGLGKNLERNIKLNDSTKVIVSRKNRVESLSLFLSKVKVATEYLSQIDSIDKELTNLNYIIENKLCPVCKRPMKYE